MESRSSARGGDHGHRHHLDHQQQLLLLQLAAARNYAGGGVSWPTQRSPSSSSYTCRYCKGKFRSAQALGGHTNVHRRERARLRHHYCSSYPAAPAGVHRDRVPNFNFSPPAGEGQELFKKTSSMEVILQKSAPSSMAHSCMRLTKGEDHGHRHHLDHHQQLLLRPAGGGSMSWPTQRSSSSYTCGYGYCKREFQSKQALGGHMSGHRRERARLRHYCSNPAAATYRDRVPNLNFWPPHCTGGDYGDSASTTTLAFYSFFSTVAAAKAALVVDLEVGVGGGLNLELRLGCS